jgi:hypothetical protein
MEHVRRGLEILNFPTQVRKTKDDEISFSFRIGVEGPLFTREIERCFVGFEISKREEVLREPKAIGFGLLSRCPSLHGLGDGFRRNLRGKNQIHPDQELCQGPVRSMVPPQEAGQSEEGAGYEKLKYYGKEFDEGELRRLIERRGEYWRSELEPLVLGRLPDFETIKRKCNRTRKGGIDWYSVVADGRNRETVSRSPGNFRETVGKPGNSSGKPVGKLGQIWEAEADGSGVRCLQMRLVADGVGLPAHSVKPPRA